MDKLRPATLLLAVLAAWAVALLVLGMMGLGGRFELEPNDTSLAPQLPRFTLTKINSRLGPLTDYQEVADRPLMMAERRPVAISAGPDADTADFDVVLTSVLITPNLQLAILTDTKGGASRRVKMGETVAGTSWRLSQLEPRRAVFDSPAGQRTLDLRVYDGSGGIPVTPMAEGAPPNPEDSPAPAMVSAPAQMVKPGGVAPPPPAPVPVPGEGVTQQPAPQSQEQQIEAIRRRIEARRAQAQAEQAQEKSGQK